MTHPENAFDETVVEVSNAQASSSIVLVCEHASAHIPARFKNLGLDQQALESHVAWDPGAKALASEMAKRLDAVLIAAKTSRLIYDCNRPPHAPDAMPARSEVVDVPGNAHLTPDQISERVATFYEPFRAALSNVVKNLTNPILVTVHSFTPIYHGTLRDVEIGILHDQDARLADAMMSSSDTPHLVRRNEPYGPSDGVTHTLKEHALPGGHLNVMLEVRNDLITDHTAQAAMADTLSTWLTRALAKTEATTC